MPALRCSIVLMIPLLVPLAAAGEDPRLEASRAATAQFQQRLRGELGAALAEGGALGAIDVCQRRAPAIGAELSMATGAKVGRTALRVRNPANAPDDWQREVLQDFSHQLKAGPAPAVLERFETAADGSARYARAIRTDAPCLACHGSTLAPAVGAAVGRHYPQDRATGFAVGDLRGAFVVDWAAPEEPQAGEAGR